jgi:predicted aminopeptidase
MTQDEQLRKHYEEEAMHAIDHEAERDFWKDYRAANVKDRRRALYGHRLHELVEFVKAHASEYSDTYAGVNALVDAAEPQSTNLITATMGLAENLGLRQVEKPLFGRRYAPEFGEREVQ